MKERESNGLLVVKTSWEPLSKAPYTLFRFLENEIEIYECRKDISIAIAYY